LTTSRARLFDRRFDSLHAYNVGLSQCAHNVLRARCEKALSFSASLNSHFVGMAFFML
jgi:hypothetical protein